jgi:hypothetical protein
MYHRNFTPERISSLKENEIFVFGSNLKGFHGGGAAAAALHHFGAIWGKGVGLQGQSYAIPTMHGGPEAIQPYVDEFIQFAKDHPGLTFYVTKIGCGIAGFEIAEIAPLFREAIDVENIILPEEFVDLLVNQTSNNAKSNYLTHIFGVTKTLAEILIELNKETPFTDKDEAVKAVIAYLRRLVERGDQVAFDSLIILHSALMEPNVFVDGVLNAPLFKQKISDKNLWRYGCDKIYEAYCKERLANLVLYLNDIRHYSSAEEIQKDLDTLKVSDVNHCGPNSEYYFFNITFSRPYLSFCRSILDYWDEITTYGELDEDKFRELFFNKHERGLRKYGLEAVIKHDYEPSGPCHPDIFVPKELGTSPYYLLQKNGKYSRMCAPRFPDNFYERMMAETLLEDDPKYYRVGYYFIPKEDMTLPVYEKGSKMSFANEEEKLQWIAKMQEENGENDIQ